MWRIWRVYCGVTRGSRNARPVKGNHQDCDDEKQLLSASGCINPCNQIVYYGTTDQNFPDTKSSNSHKSVGINHSLYEYKRVNYQPQTPEYKWGSENYHKGRCRQIFRKDVGRWCRRQKRQQMLLTYSVLQAFGWGSVFALSWTMWKSHSMHHHSKQQCPTHYWPFQAESLSILFNNEAHNCLLKYCENNENVKQSEYIYSSNSYNQSYYNNYGFNLDIDRSLFSYLYSVVSNQPVIESYVKDKRQSSKRAHNKNSTVNQQTDLEVLTSEEHTHSQSYSHKLKKPDSPLYQSNIDLQPSCLSENCETPNVVTCVSDKSTGFFENSASNTVNNDNQNKFNTKTEVKIATEIVTIEDCSESGISSTSSNGCKKTDATNNRDNAEDIQKVIQHELNAIRAVQEKVNGLLQGDLGFSLIDTDPKSAILHFQAGALLSDPDATYNLALCLHMGKGVKQNYKLARKYYSQASKAGHNWATYNLAVLVSEGLGGPVDSELAYSLLQTAAERGVKEAKDALRAMEENRDDLMDTKHTDDIGIIDRSQSLHRKPEKVTSSPRSATMQCIDVNNQFDELTLSKDLSSNPIALQRPSFYIESNFL